MIIRKWENEHKRFFIKKCSLQGNIKQNKRSPNLGRLLLCCFLSASLKQDYIRMILSCSAIFYLVRNEGNQGPADLCWASFFHIVIGISIILNSVPLMAASEVWKLILIFMIFEVRKFNLEKIRDVWSEGRLLSRVRRL